ncbi:MAG: hypothetical protein K2I75_02000, partial [Clostridiales bacterium]|nr:hypothetical protein [Clostridiales bacterium]
SSAESYVYKTQEYINEYLASGDFQKIGEENGIFNNLKTKIEYFEYKYKISGCDGLKEKTVMTITDKANTKHIYECIDTFFTPYEFEYKGTQYLIFRKSLYGYTILNLTDFTEKNYFPSRVLEGEEAFIICEAKILKNLLVLGGCLWGGPYECRVLNLDTSQIANISKICNITDVVGEINVPDNALILQDENTNNIIKLEYEKLVEFVELKHNEDL